MDIKQSIQKQFSSAKNLASIDFVIFSKSQPVTQEEHKDPLAKDIAYLIENNQDMKVNEALRRMLTWEITKEDIELINRSIFPASYFTISGMPSK